LVLEFFIVHFFIVYSGSGPYSPLLRITRALTSGSMLPHPGSVHFSHPPLRLSIYRGDDSIHARVFYCGHFPSRILKTKFKTVYRGNPKNFVALLKASF